MEKSPWKAYFAFTKKERSAITVLGALIIVLCILPWFFRPIFEPPRLDNTLLQQLSEATQQAAENAVENSTEEAYPTTVAAMDDQLHPFPFDPNTLDAQGFRKMGLRDKTIRTLLNYRGKGGRFNAPEDIRKIYGLRPEEADALIPFIRIRGNINTQPVQVLPDEAQQQYQATNAITTIDINHATPEELESLPGIGPVLSKRIVKFRAALNGFTAVEDIKRTYGLSDSVYQAILPFLTITPFEQEPE